jgi:hypothetical protein
MLELGIAERPPIAHGHLDRIGSIRQRHVAAVDKSLLPTLSGIARPIGLPS